MKICVAGKNNIAVDVLEHLLYEKKIKSEDLSIIPNKCVGDDDGWQRSLIKAARENDVKIVKLEEIYDIEDLVLFSIQYERIIRPSLFASNKLYNMHFAPLPKYKGMYTSILPLINGEKESGVTIHEIDEGIDSGDIISQKRFEIGLMDNERDLYFKYMKYGLELFRESVDDLLTGNYKKYRQPSIGSTICYARELDYKQANVDLTKTSFEIHNRIRAFIFPEFQLPIVNGYSIYKSELTDDKTERFRFEVLNDYIEISGSDGYIVKAYYKQ